MEYSREKIWVWRGFLLVWIIGNEISEHSIAFCWVRSAGKMPASATYCTEYYRFNKMKDQHLSH